MHTLSNDGVVYACANSRYKATFSSSVVVWCFFSLCHHSHYIGEDWVRKFPLVTGCGASSRTAYTRVVTGVIVIGMTVALLTLVAGGVLSAPNG